MQRRGFLQSLGAAIAGTAAAISSQASAPAREFFKRLPKSKPAEPKKEFTPGIKPDRAVWSANYPFMDQNASAGSVVSLDTSQDSYECVKLQEGEEAPIGILLNDIVSIDLTTTRINTCRTVCPGSKVEIMRQGNIVASVDGHVKVGDAIYAYDHKMTSKKKGHKIGTALTSSDSEGFVRILLNV